MKEQAFFDKVKELYFEGLTHQSIADELGQSVESISFHISTMGLSGQRDVNTQMRKERLEKSRLTDAKVRQLLAMRLRGVPYTELCTVFEIPRGYCFDIIRGKKYLSDDKVIGVLRRRLEMTIKPRRKRKDL